MHSGCNEFEVIAALEDSDEGPLGRNLLAHASGRPLRSRRAKTTNLIVQACSRIRNAVGIFGYSFLYENQDTLKAVSVEGVEPTFHLGICRWLVSGKSRPLFFYIKERASRCGIPGLTEFVELYVSEDVMGPGGLLCRAWHGSAPRMLPAKRPGRKLLTAVTFRSLRQCDMRPLVSGRGGRQTAATFCFSDERSGAMLTNALLAILILSVLAFMVGRFQARRFAEAGSSQEAAFTPGVYHGAFVAIWVGIPALVLRHALAGFSRHRHRQPDHREPSRDIDAPTHRPRKLDLYLSEIKNVANGIIFGEPQPAISAAAERYERWSSIARWAMIIVLLCLMIITLFFAQSPFVDALSRAGRVSSAAVNHPDGHLLGHCHHDDGGDHRLAAFRSLVLLFAGSAHGIPVRHELGTADRRSAPTRLPGAGAFGAVPVFVGTLLIATIAMFVATPIGLFSGDLSGGIRQRPPAPHSQAV